MYELKNKLLATGYFIENEALYEYIMLISTNKTTEPNYNTQTHHIIPKSYFKALHLAINNNIDNLVTLLYKDHVKAHWLLFCCTTGFLKKQSAMAFRKMVNYEKDFLASALTSNDYLTLQEQYEQTCIRVDKETLYSLYIVQNKTREEIAADFNCSVSCIKKFLKQYKITKNNFKTIEKQEFIDYYQNHSMDDTFKHFNISQAKAQNLLNLYNCHKDRRSDSLWQEINFNDVYIQYKQGKTLRSLAKNIIKMNHASILHLEKN